MQKTKTMQKRKSRKILWTALAAIVVIAAGLAIYQFGFHKTPKTTGVTQDGQKVNLQPATPADKQANDANKQAIVDRNQQLNSSSPPTSSGQLKQVSVVVTSATASGVRAYVNGVFEDGGTCTATATQGSQKVTKTSTGFQNVSYTQCAPINWDTALGSGNWTITVTYNSSAATGTTSQTLGV